MAGCCVRWMMPSTILTIEKKSKKNQQTERKKNKNYEEKRTHGLVCALIVSDFTGNEPFGRHNINGATIERSFFLLHIYSLYLLSLPLAYVMRKRERNVFCVYNMCKKRWNYNKLPWEYKCVRSFRLYVYALLILSVLEENRIQIYCNE